MVGASLARRAGALGCARPLIEAVPHDAAAQPSFDERTTALSNGSRRILETLGVWPEVAMRGDAASPRFMSRTRDTSASRASMRAEQGLAAMGYVVPNRALGAALWSRLRARADSQFLSRAGRAISGRRAMRSNSDVVDRGGAPERVSARLVVAADGAESVVRAAFGVGAEVRDYGQTAVITTVLPQQVSRARGLRALHRRGSAGVAAARRRPLHAGVDLEPRRRPKRPWPGRIEEFLAEVQRALRISAWAASSK